MREDTKILPWRDVQFGAALAAAPLVLYVVWLVHPVQPDWSWPLRAVSQYLLLALVYPVIEEVVFRGAVQGTIFRQPWGSRKLGVITLANLLTSVAFTVIHFIHHPPVWAVLVFFPSLVFGYFKDRYQRLSVPILLHVFYNTGFFWLFKPA